MSTALINVWLLKEDGARKERGSPAPAAEDDTCRSRILACAACKARITSDAARIEVGGSHEHTFANPFGYVYHVGCFASAVGLKRIGRPSSEFPWFPGYLWQIEPCAACGEHLGWWFQGAESGFHGLILNRLVEIEERE